MKFSRQNRVVVGDITNHGVKMQQYHHEKQATFSQEVSLNIYAVAVASIPSRTKKVEKLPDTTN